jgi:hypothetical protein
MLDLSHAECISLTEGLFLPLFWGSPGARTCFEVQQTLFKLRCRPLSSSVKPSGAIGSAAASAPPSTTAPLRRVPRSLAPVGLTDEHQKRLERREPLEPRAWVRASPLGGAFNIRTRRTSSVDDIAGADFARSDSDAPAAVADAPRELGQREHAPRSSGQVGLDRALLD